MATGPTVESQMKRDMMEAAAKRREQVESGVRLDRTPASAPKRDQIVVNPLKRDRDQAAVEAHSAHSGMVKAPPMKVMKKPDGSDPHGIRANASPRPTGTGANQSSSAANNPLAKSKYGALLTVIEELGKDIRPTYSANKLASERLKRSLIHARIVVRECMLECERISKS